MARRRRDDEETTGQVRVRLLEAFALNERTCGEVGEFVARLLGPVPGRPQVLVVEDNVQLLEAYCRALESDCDVLSARDADEAERLLSGARGVDLVILDLLLPVGSGLDVARAVRERWKEAPILVVSGYLDSRMESELRALGGPFEFHDKPSSEVVEVARRHARGPQ